MHTAFLLSGVGAVATNAAKCWNMLTRKVGEGSIVMEEQPCLTLFEIDPLTDPRWQTFVDRHPQGSIFLGTGWMRALAMTYGYTPVAFTTTPLDEPLTNAIAFCELRSWLTGHRFVSLPFTDHCSPLVNNGDGLRTLLSSFRAHPHFIQSNFAEIRGGSPFVDSCSDLCKVSARYVHHTLSLAPPLESIYSRLHKSCIQRAIRRAEKEGLRIECGRSDALVVDFYRLLVITRQRHGLPPQPLKWFRNLASTMGDQIGIRVAYYGSQAVAGIVTLTDGRAMVYKYGGSDARWHKLGGVPLIMWGAIVEAKAKNLTVFDFGRTDLHDEGLLQFKERFGAVPAPLAYYRVSNKEHLTAAMRVPDGRAVRKLFRKLPVPILEMFGRILYRHVG